MSRESIYRYLSLSLSLSRQMNSEHGSRSLRASILPVALVQRSREDCLGGEPHLNSLAAAPDVIMPPDADTFAPQHFLFHFLLFLVLRAANFGPLDFSRQSRFFNLIRDLASLLFFIVFAISRD